ncbi:hypothetical protein F383_36677 [Gossypium arboreum]|uniref:Uncharacterized protein n=1 Tax=Gossypium arboreum TaxID=29729 RepID=A0A0B0MDL3_GOSAR|nr:hypothetical protein F383_36677 [Gossypium arboreum]
MVNLIFMYWQWSRFYHQPHLSEQSRSSQMMNLIFMYQQWSRFYHQPYFSKVAREQWSRSRMVNPIYMYRQ